MKDRRPPPRRFPAARGLRFAAALILAAVGAASITACAPFRQRLEGEEAGEAAAFFASSADVSFPVHASFSGIAELSSGRSFPFIAGLFSRTPLEETLGFYDPMGHAIFFLGNAGGLMSVTRGPAAKEFPPGNLRPLETGPLSIGRILSGAPGRIPSGGEAGTGGDGGWIHAGEGQVLFSDPARKTLSRAEYDISGKRVTVTYPERDSPGIPRIVEVEVMGNRIVLRRDAE